MRLVSWWHFPESLTDRFPFIKLTITPEYRYAV